VLLAEYDQTLRYLLLSDSGLRSVADGQAIGRILAVPGKQWTS